MIVVYSPTTGPRDGSLMWHILQERRALKRRKLIGQVIESSPPLT